MISGIIGLPGSGKSTLLSYIAFRAVHGKSINFKGFRVQNFKYKYIYTNFPCIGAYKLDFDLLGKADYNNCLMLCDEIQLLADCRNYKDFSEEFKEFFSMHRHDRQQKYNKPKHLFYFHLLQSIRHEVYDKHLEDYHHNHDQQGY